MENARLLSPFRTNDVDSYSHLLFIMDDHVRMRKLADEIYHADRFTAESSIALGMIAFFFVILTIAQVLANRRSRSTSGL